MNLLRVKMLKLLMLVCVMGTASGENTQILKNVSYNILILTSPLGAKSHSIYFNEIAKRLASRGHQVVHRCAGQLELVEGVKNYVINEAGYPEKFMVDVAFDGDTLRGFVKTALTLVNVLLDAVNSTYNDPLIIDVIRQPLSSVTRRPKYDVVLVDHFIGEMYLPLVHHLGVPSVLVSSSTLMSPYAWNLNVPFNYLFNYNGFPEPMDIWSRARTVTFHLFLNFLFYFYLTQKQDEVVKTFLSNAPPLADLVGDISFVMTANPPAIQDSVPMVPHAIDVGCAQCRPAKPLPQDLEDIIQRSGDYGVIYFSLGSFVRPEWIPKEVVQKIIKVLSGFPQTILWKGSAGVSNVSNFYVRDWFPQQDLLAHSKLRLIINNGGLATMQEAAYHACPILGFPLNVDHKYAMKIAQKIGFGEHLEWRTFTVDQMNRTVLRMLTNSSYKESALRASIRLRDVIDSPSSQAAYWTEYVIRHNGASFMKNQARRLNWYQYFLIDVIALILFVCVIIVTLLIWTFKLGFVYVRKLV